MVAHYTLANNNNDASGWPKLIKSPLFLTSFKLLASFLLQKYFFSTALVERTVVWWWRRRTTNNILISFEKWNSHTLNQPHIMLLNKAMNQVFIIFFSLYDWFFFTLSRSLQLCCASEFLHQLIAFENVTWSHSCYLSGK